MLIPSKRHRSLDVIVAPGEFYVRGSDPQSTRKILDGIKDRYRMNSGRCFELGDRVMVDIMAIWKVLDRENPDPETIHVLVSDLIMSLHSSDEVNFVKTHTPAAASPEDELCNILQSKINTEVTIDSLCRQLGIDCPGACRRFASIYGKTPYSYLKYYRMIDAASTILLGERSMEDVGRSVGYSAECKFAESFRKQFGCRPKHFITQYQTYS